VSLSEQALNERRVFPGPVRGLGRRLVTLVLLGSCGPSLQARDKPLPSLTRQHRIASSTATFRTPEEWVISVAAGSDPEVVNAEGGNLAVRFLRWDSELGLDALHVMCMVERLDEPMAIEPRTRYEYEFVGGEQAQRRVLDTAFAVQYTAPVKGFAEWRQRVVTLVGKGEGLCVVAFCPLPLWKKSREARDLLKAVVASVSLP
jgi:hypothetical protein